MSSLADLQNMPKNAERTKAISDHISRNLAKSTENIKNAKLKNPGLPLRRLVANQMTPAQKAKLGTKLKIAAIKNGGVTKIGGALQKVKGLISKIPKRAGLAGLAGLGAIGVAGGIGAAVAHNKKKKLLSG